LNSWTTFVKDFIDFWKLALKDAPLVIILWLVFVFSKALKINVFEETLLIGGSLIQPFFLLFLVTPAERKERESSNQPVFLVKLRNSELIIDSTASFMVHVRGNPNPDVKL
jgi:hypothetical protein